MWPIGDKGRHGGSLLLWRTLLFTVLALAGYLIPGAAPESWVFDRTAIEQGEVWRLVTGHWVHSGFVHAFWDIAALAVLTAVAEYRLRWQIPLALLAGTLGVDLWLWWGEGTPVRYCGLSGILHSLLAVVLVRFWCDLRHPLVLLAGLTLVLKTGAEITEGAALLTRTAWPSVPAAHAAGILSGLLLMILINLTRKLRGSSSRAGGQSRTVCNG